jgi:hypothetical protein
MSKTEKLYLNKMETSAAKTLPNLDISFAQSSHKLETP